MAYQVFARKYRPQTFAEVVGQEHITQTLQNAITLGRLAQAYLFVGPRGTGKTSLARIMAKALNCSNGPRADFDPNEEICREIADGNCLDVLEIDGASNNGVEQVRDLRDNVRYTPVRGRFKIYIIDEVHMLSTPAFNALLKTLEEPPAHIKFIFATTEVHKLPATILSRCQRFDLRRIPDAKIASHLQKICGLENVNAEPAALQTLARYAEGGLRDAESSLDQTISFYGDKLTESEVLLMFGLTGIGPVAALAEAIASGDTVAALRQSRTLIEAGKDLGRLTQDLLRFFRNVVIHQLSPEAVHAELTEAEFNAVAAVSGKVSRAGAMAVLEELSQVESRLRYALAKDVLFEVALLQLTRLKERVSLETILASLAPGAGSVLPAQPAAPAAALPPSKSPAAAAAPAPEPVKNPAGIWQQAIDKFIRETPLEKDTLLATRFVASRANVFEISLPPRLKNKLAYLKSPKVVAWLEQELQQACGRPVQIAYLLIDPPDGETPPSPASTGGGAPPPRMTEAEFQNDPLIREALELFQARVLKN
jgi:DNA polymerase-3 subunit gamma/tau